MEEHFYLLWPMLLVWLSRRTRDATPVAYLSIAFGLWRVCVAQTGITYGLLSKVVWHARTDLRADALLWGCFLAFLVHAPGTRETLKRHLSAPVVMIAAAAATGCVIRFSMLSSLWFAMLVPVVLVGTMLHPNSLAGRFLEMPPMRFVGKISYSLYLWQQLFFAPAWEHQVSPFRNWPTNLALVFACATLSYYVIDKPCMAYGRRLAARARRPRSGSPGLFEDAHYSSHRPGG